MDDDKTLKPAIPQIPDEDVKQTEIVEELSIFELDERLEFVAWCDNCSCTVPE